MFSENFALRSPYMCKNRSCKAIFNFTVVYKALQRSLTNQSQHVVFSTNQEQKQIMTWLTCIFPRLTRNAFFFALDFWLIALYCGCCQCAGSYRSHGMEYVRKVPSLSSACKNVRTYYFTSFCLSILI